MTATPFETPHAATNFFDIYNDAAAATRNSNPAGLPAGGCNFVDLTPGANGARCGCRRFWTRQALGSPIPDQTGWCMCNHHACYHDQGDRDTRAPDTSNVPGQENERPRTGREPLSPVVDVPFNMLNSVPGLGFPSFNGGASPSFTYNKTEEAHHGATAAYSQQPLLSMPDTLPWGQFIQSQAANGTLPPIPPQCLMPSQTASTTSSVQAQYLRPFAGKGLHTLGGPRGTKLPPQSQQDKHLQCSIAPNQGPHGVDGSFILVPSAGISTPRPGSATQAEPRVAAAVAIDSSVSREAFKNLTDTVSGHEQRLDRLETVSFSGNAHDDCHDKNEHMDLRMIELESRVEEVEKTAQDFGAAQRTDRTDDGTTQSVASFATNTTSRPTHSQELMSQVQSLQAQVAHLQSAIPSFNHVWKLEVVFLPFPLKKIWQDVHQFKLDPSGSSDEWTQLPMTHSTATMRSQSPFFGDWATRDHDAEWLLPKACGANSVTDMRLRSRGLIKSVSLRGPDSRTVQMAINAAFGDVFGEMQLPTQAQGSDPRVSKFLGLQSTWVPLRKIHKDSRLRFLSPSEMLTPALWDVQFLHSIMMRAAEPRLFITHPDAYLQDYQAYETGWTWQRLREMSRVYPDVTESQEVPEADALEEHWAWSGTLDDPPSAQTSMKMRQDRQRVSASPSIAHIQAAQSFRSSSPVILRGQSPMLKGRRGSRPPHIRTASMPMGAPAYQSPGNSKRRVISYEQTRRPSPSIRAPPQSAIVKRRATRSPSHARFTPRWTASPSPGIGERQFVRGTTPFAYATPHSNAPLQEVRRVSGGSGGQNEYGGFPMLEDDDNDDDYDINIYESGSESFGDGESMESADLMTHAQTNAHYDSQHHPLPEDEVWPGIEDQGHRSDGENIDPRQQVERQDADQLSDASSQPSEYPSTQRAWPNEAPAGFRIHED